MFTQRCLPVQVNLILGKSDFYQNTYFSETSGQSSTPDQSLSVQQPPVDQSSGGQSLTDQSSVQQSLTGQSSGTQTSRTIECPAIRRIPTSTIGNCAGGPGRMDCPSGAQCLIDTVNGVSFCCWEETSIVSCKYSTFYMIHV